MNTTPPTSPAPSEPRGDAASAAAKDPGIALLRGSLPRILGYGLLGLFAIDAAQSLVNYRPFNPEADAGLVVMLVERSAVPLVAYALIFATNTAAAERRERTVLKLISIGALIGLFAYAALGALAIASGYRITNRGSLNISRQAYERTQGLETALKNVPTATSAQLLAVYRSIVVMTPDMPVPGHEELVKFAQEKIPGLIQKTREDADATKASLAKQQTIFGVKYAAAGWLSALLFLVIWENTRGVRRHRIFAQKNAPSMMLEDKLAGGFQTMQTRIGDALFLPNLEKYRWYRKLRRFFGGRR